MSRSGSPLPASRLGTKQHWDSVYAREADNFFHHGDEGEVWFGDEAVDRLVSWFERAAAVDASSGSDAGKGDGADPVERVHPLPLPPDQLAILDLGTGNGNVLFGLVQAETDPAPAPARMLGVDYCEDSVTLARAIAVKRGEAEQQVRFASADVLDRESVAALRARSADMGQAGDTSDTGTSGRTSVGWNLVLDKGTYDAIALSSEPDAEGKTPVQRYEALVPTLLADGGLLVICSCNFTAAELVARFTAAPAGLDRVTVVPAPTFSFVRAHRDTCHVSKPPSLLAPLLTQPCLPL